MTLPENSEPAATAETAAPASPDAAGSSTPVSDLGEDFQQEPDTRRRVRRDSLTPPPLWLLDVDGVLNAIASKPDRSVWPEWSSADATDSAGRTFPILFAPALLGRLRALHVSGAVEIQWLTTWAHDANTALCELLDLPPLRVAGAPPHHPVVLGEPTDPDQDAQAPRAHADVGGAHAADALTGHWWKFDAVRSLLEADPHRVVIWTDDDLRWEPEVVAWVRAHANALLIAPRSRLGLTPKQLRAIEEFILSSAPAALTDLNGSPLVEEPGTLDAV